MGQAALDALPVVLVALISAAIVSFLLTPLTIRYADKLGAIDVPNDERRVHAKPIPRTGGLAVAAAFVLVGLGGIAINAVFQFAPLRQVPTQHIVALFVGVTVGAFLGYLDDRLAAPARAGNSSSSSLLAGIAHRLRRSASIACPSPFGDEPIIRSAIAAAMAATTLWIVGMINSVNFIDGLDGLLAGVALIAVSTLGIISLVSDPIQPSSPCMCALLAGSLIGFLPYNFHPRARVHRHGRCLRRGLRAGRSVGHGHGQGRARAARPWACRSSTRSGSSSGASSERRSPFSADRGHLHHRLLDLGPEPPPGGARHLRAGRRPGDLRAAAVRPWPDLASS